MLSYFLAAVLCDQQCLQDGIHCNFVPRCLQVDVANKRCQESGCTMHPSYGLLGGKAQYCAEHKSADMVCYRCPSLLIHYEHAALCDQQYLQNGMHCNCVSGACRSTLLPSPVRSQGAQSNPLSACQAERLNSAWSTSPLTWCVTQGVCFLAALLDDDRAICIAVSALDGFVVRGPGGRCQPAL